MSQCKCIAGLLLKPALLPVWRSAFSENLLPPNRLRTLIHPIPFSQLRKTKITKNNPSGKPGSLHNYIRRRSAQEKQLAVFGQRPHLVVDDLLQLVDVAADLGHSPEMNHRFWRDFRKTVKEVNPDALILAEHYGDASDWLSGDQWDTVMNYDAFMEPISWFLTGLEKHSERKDEHLLHNSQAFMCSMLSNMSRMQTGSLYAAMNELSNHDHSRFLTRTNRMVGRLYKPEDAENAEKGINYGTFRSGALIQMTWPGAPTIYYGDEAGVCGWTDPDNRRTFPWGKEDLELTEFHRYLTGIRNRTPAFRRGAFKSLLAENGMIAYGRFDADEQGVVVVNSEDYAQRVRIPVWEAEVTADAMVRVMLTDAKRYNVGSLKYPVVDGVMEVELPGNGAMIFIARSSGQDDEKTA